MEYNRLKIYYVFLNKLFGRFIDIIIVYIVWKRLRLYINIKEFNLRLKFFFGINLKVLIGSIVLIDVRMDFLKDWKIV